jgi:putative endopeptidase
MHQQRMTHLALAIVAALALTACNQAQQGNVGSSAKPAAASTPPVAAHAAPAPAPASTVAIPADQPIAFTLDDQHNPCNDFADYVNAKWNAANPIPSDQVYWGGFMILHEKSMQQQKALLETAAYDAKHQTGSEL